MASNIPKLRHIETLDITKGINTNIQQVVSIHDEENLGSLPMFKEILDSNYPIPDAIFWKFLKQATPDEKKILSPEIEKPTSENPVIPPKEEEVKKEEPIITEKQIENKENSQPLEEKPIKEDNFLPKKSFHDMITSTNEEIIKNEDPLSFSLVQPDPIEDEIDNKQEDFIDNNIKEEEITLKEEEIPSKEDNNTQVIQEEKEKSVHETKEENVPKEEINVEESNPMIEKKDIICNKQANEVIKENNDLPKKTLTEILNDKENIQKIKEQIKQNDIKIPSKIDINTTQPDKDLKELRDTNINNATEEATKACNCCIIF